MFKHLASNPDNSNGRLYNELDEDLRNPFERDRARVIHSNSFRKLKHKTQVFIESESAQNHINKILLSEKSNYFRITVLGGGCAGFQYKFDFSDKPNKDDLIFNYKNADVLIDKTSIELIKGSKIDYVNELIGSSFKISNPLASSSCGCGTSFSI